MAENKRSFLLYVDLIHTVKKLPKDKQADLFMHILEYVNDENPQTNDFIIELAFEPIKQSLKRDLIKYQKTCEKNKENAEKRWNAKNATASDGIRPDAMDADNDSGNDSDSDNDILLRKETKANFNFKASLLDYGFEKTLIEDWLKVRKTKRATNTETALKNFIHQVEKCGKDKNEILRTCIEKDWRGFEAEWMINVTNQLNGKTTPYPITQNIKKQQQDEFRELTASLRQANPGI